MVRVKSLGTRERLLEAAEVMFAQHGFQGSTLREITELAGVNLAGVNYHFGSKEELFREMLRQRVAPINARRLEMLEEALSASGGAPLTLEEIFAIILDPLVEALTRGGKLDEVFLGIITRSITDTSTFVQNLHRSFFRSVSERFMSEMVRALGETPLSEEKVSWRIFFALSAMLGSIIQHHRIEPYFPSIGDARDMSAMTRELIEFICAGLRSECRRPVQQEKERVRA